MLSPEKMCFKCCTKQERELEREGLESNVILDGARGMSNEGEREREREREKREIRLSPLRGQYLRAFFLSFENPAMRRMWKGQ